VENRFLKLLGLSHNSFFSESVLFEDTFPLLTRPHSHTALIMSDLVVPRLFLGGSSRGLPSLHPVLPCPIRYRVSLQLHTLCLRCVDGRQRGVFFFFLFFLFFGFFFLFFAPGLFPLNALR